MSDRVRYCRPADADDTAVHGPTPCGPVPWDEPECACGCSAYEDACPAYSEWYAKKYGYGDKP